MMSATMPLDALETLRQVNDNLRTALIRFRPEQKGGSIIRPQEFSALQNQLVQAAECLQHLPHFDAASAFPSAFQRESLEYRGNLVKLREFLPAVQQCLLAEKSRIEIARSHVAAAAAWVRASKETL